VGIGAISLGLRGERRFTIVALMIEEKFRRACQRQARLGTRSLRQSPRESPDRRRRHQIARRVIDRLHRERRGLVGAQPLHSGIRDARAHLDEAVEAAPSRPGPRPPVRVESNVDKRRRYFPASRSIESQCIERPGAVAVDKDVGFRKQLRKNATAIAAP